MTAWLSGARFVGNMSNGASLAMALAAGIAILSYVLILFTADNGGDATRHAMTIGFPADG